MSADRLQELEQELQRRFDEADSDGAKQLLEKALADRTWPVSSISRLCHWRGRLAYFESTFTDARSYFIRALEADPDDWFSRFYLARIAEGLGEEDPALALYARCVDEQPEMRHVADFMTGILKKRPTGVPAVDRRAVSQERPHGSAVPLISIVILCYNKMEFTARCLRSLEEHTEYPNYEVIVVDNASADDTPSLLETFSKRITFLRAPRNLGFVGGNNFAADAVSGAYTVFLNNDTEPQKGWLTELLAAFQRDPRTGAAGSMLLYPDGRLQEAGGVIFRDATGWNFGKGHQPGHMAFTFAREVDYCSGAALMVRTDLFRRLGGFDERFAPAYFEDTDLCFGVRKLGYRVMYCPSSRVVHFEGATAGTDLNSGFKRFQVLNTPKFQEKWAGELQKQCPNDPALVYRFTNRSRAKHVLIIDDWPPLPDRAAGSLRLYHTVRQMLALGYRVTYAHLMGARLDESARRHMKELSDLGVEFKWMEYEIWWPHRELSTVRPILAGLIESLDIPKRDFALVYICFWHIAEYFIDFIRASAPDLPIVIDSMDLHYLRERRQAEITKDPGLRKKADETKRRELAVYAKADAVTTVTERDRETLREDLPNTPVFIMTDVHDPVASRTPFDARRDFLFVGNFNHNPNEDAVVWFVREIFPRISKELPEARFLVVGNNPTPAVKALASERVIVTGWVPEIAPYLEQCRVSVVPLRFGAGNKGKVGETLSHGLPMVSTTIGAEGMGIVHDEHSFIADDVDAFAAFAVRLYRERERWERFAERGKALIAGQYSSALKRRRIEYLTSYPTREAFRSRQAQLFPLPPAVSIVIPVFNQWDFTKQCLDSIRAQTTLSHEVILIDNASTDKTPRGVREYPEVRVITNPVNVGFPGAVNQGINAAIGEYVLILNNDTVVTEKWLERLVAVAASDSKIGIVGPVSNSVSGVQLDREAVYSDIPSMHLYAAARREARRGQIVNFPRVAFLCTLIKRAVIDAIGGLDERFAPGNYEDDDFCLRAQLAGFKTVVAADVFIHHFGSKSFKAGGERAYAGRLQENRKRFEGKWGNHPDGIWLEGASFRRRNVRVPIHRDPFIQAFERATLLIEAKEFALAKSELDLALSVFHSSERRGYLVEFVEVLNLAGNLSLMLGDLESAKQHFENEVRLTPASLPGCLGLVRVFRAAGLVDAAEAMLQAARAIAPDDPAVAAEEAALRSMVAAEDPA